MAEYLICEHQHMTFGRFFNFDKRRTLYNLCTSRSFLDNDVKGVQNLRTAFLVTKRMSCACVLETYHMCCLQSLRQSVGALVTNLVGMKIKDGHRLVALVTFLVTATQPSCKKNSSTTATG